MKENKKATYFTIGILLIALLPVALLLPQVPAGSMGFGPTEIVGSNKRDSLVIGTASLINAYHVAKYGVFSLKIPYSNENNWQPMPTEQRYIRVICRDCGAEMERYEAIENYVYPSSPLVGKCEKCGSTNLIFYELISRDEFYSLSLEGADKFDLKKEGNFVYVTTEKIPPGETCNINVLYNTSDSYVKENEGKYWEARLTATLKEKLNEEGIGVVSGIGVRLLIEFKFPLFIDAPDIIEKGEDFTVHVVYGDPQRTWEKTPQHVKVTFNGEAKWINEDGSVTFTAPDTRRNYSYEIKAEGTKYLPEATITKTGIIVEESTFPYMMLGFIAGGFVVLFCLVCIYKKRSAIASALDGFKSRSKPKPAKANIKHVRKPLFSLGDVAIADIGQPEQKEPSTSFLGDVRDAIMADTIPPNREETLPTSGEDIEDAATTDIKQPKHETEFSDIKAEIDRILKSHEK